MAAPLQVGRHCSFPSFRIVNNIWIINKFPQLQNLRLFTKLNLNLNYITWKNFDVFVNYLHTIQFYMVNICHYAYNTSAFLSLTKISVCANEVWFVLTIKGVNYLQNTQFSVYLRQRL
jgi:hypothetical protein